MKTHIARLSATAVAVLLSLPLTVTAQKPGTGNIEVSVTIADVGPSGVPYRVQSDGKGPYVTTMSGKTTLVSSLLIASRPGTDWSLTTYAYTKGLRLVPSERTVLFDLAEVAAPGSFPAPPLGSGYVSAHLIAKCSAVNVDMTRMAQGSIVECPGGLRFLAPDGLWYRLAFDPDKFAHVDRIAVTCTAADMVNGVPSCRTWFVAPATARTTLSDDPNVKSLNRLLHIDDGGAVLNQDGGDYYMSFAFTVSR